ncbi:MAG TPA: hypothetical protein VGH28_23675 [Polyangiaceae bacterium]|jgi:hypothetical protein
MKLRFLPLALILAACGGTTTNAPNDAGPDSDTDVAASCNALANGAPVLALSLVASDPPAMQGGTIQDGLYFMTAAEIDTGAGGTSGPSGESSQVTIQVTGTTVQVATKSSPSQMTVSLTPNGPASFTWTDTCPDTTTSSVELTATATSLVVVVPVAAQPGWSLVETFTKQ